MFQTYRLTALATVSPVCRTERLIARLALLTVIPTDRFAARVTFLRMLGSEAPGAVCTARGVVETACLVTILHNYPGTLAESPVTHETVLHV